jgi:hypothetical protein
VLHQAASIAIVPEIVDSSRTHPANERIAGAFSLADMAGTYGGTLVVGLLGAVRALGRDLAGGLEAAALGDPDRVDRLQRQERPAPGKGGSQAGGRPVTAGKVVVLIRR